MTERWQGARDPAPTPVLFADRGCPFAHRVLALLEHLRVPHELREAPPGEKPEGLSSWSPSGRVPLLVHGDLALGESRVMLEYLSEAYCYEGAYPASIRERARQRHAMAFVDSCLVPPHWRETAPSDEARIAECLDVLAAALPGALAGPGLLAFHVGPIWALLSWWKPEGAITTLVRRRPELGALLDEVANLPALARTSPDRTRLLGEYDAARARRTL